MTKMVRYGWLANLQWYTGFLKYRLNEIIEISEKAKIQSQIQSQKETNLFISKNLPFLTGFCNKIKKYANTHWDYCHLNHPYKNKKHPKN